MQCVLGINSSHYLLGYVLWIIHCFFQYNNGKFEGHGFIWADTVVFGNWVINNLGSMFLFFLLSSASVSFMPVLTLSQPMMRDQFQYASFLFLLVIRMLHRKPANHLNLSKTYYQANWSVPQVNLLLLLTHVK